MGLDPLLDLFAEVWRRWCLWYYGVALAQISPLHPDVPHIVRRLNELRRLG